MLQYITSLICATIISVCVIQAVVHIKTDPLRRYNDAIVQCGDNMDCVRKVSVFYSTLLDTDLLQQLK